MKTLEYEFNCKTCEKKFVLHTPCWVTIQGDMISCGYCGYIMGLKDEEEILSGASQKEGE